VSFLLLFCQLCHLIAFKDYLNSNHQGGDHSFNLEPNKFSYTYTKNSVIEPWKDWQFKYGLKSNASKMEAGPGGFSFFCITHVDGNIEEWTREHGDIAPNNYLSIVRPDCEECYILFSEDVINDNGLLNAYNVYKLNSQVTNIQNKSDETCKVLRIYK